MKTNSFEGAETRRDGLPRRRARSWLPAWLVPFVLGLSAASCGPASNTTDGSSDGAGDMVDPDAAIDVPIDTGPACTEYLWDPASGDMARWPEPAISIADPTTRTGRRLRVDATRFPGLLRSAGGYAGVLTEDISDVDGFGVNSHAFFRFNRAFDPAMLPTGNAIVQPAVGLGFVVLGATPSFIPAIVRPTDRNATLQLFPLRPLPAGSDVVVFMTRALTAAARGCLEPSPAMRRAIEMPDADVQRGITAVVAVGGAARASDLIALTVFRTQSTTDDSQLVAADIAARSFAFAAAPTCVTEMRWRRCETSFMAGDYRGTDRVMHALPMGQVAMPRVMYRIPVTVWLPLVGTGPGSAPYPTLVFGHGLGGGRTQAAQLAGFAAPLGIATVAIDAVQHGEHPSVPAMAPRDALSTVLRFFTLDPGGASGRSMRALELRDNFRQSSWDKLQLTRVLTGSPDLDGDGRPDLDGQRLAYLGVSLGGIMGPEVLALTDAYRAAILIVPGARVSSIIGESTQFRPLVLLARPSGVTDGDVDRFFALLQTVLDRGDPGSYGPHILTNRFATAGTTPPATLLGVVLDDDTVPNSANYALARALGVNIVPPVLRAEPGLEMTMPAPVSGNLPNMNTAGLLQFDVVRERDGTVNRATHSNVGASEVGATAWMRFLRSFWDRGTAEIIDPYAETMLMHR